MGRGMSSGAAVRALVGFVALSGSGLGCATAGAQRAFDQGDYRAAAGQADDALRANPSDSAMMSLRQRARDRFAEAEIARIQAFRAGKHGEAALVEVTVLLKQVRAWGGREALSAVTGSSLDLALAATREQLASLIDSDLAAGHPLSAEATLARLAPLLAQPELALARDGVANKVRAKGQELCARFRGTALADSPHWDLTVDRYCAHFGASARPIATEPVVPAFDLTLNVKGMNPAQAAALRARVIAWVRASIWNDPARGTMGRGTVDGTVEASFRRQTIALHAPYEEETVGSVMIQNGDSTIGRPLSTAPGSPGAVAPVVPVPGLVLPITNKVTREFTVDAEEVRGSYAMNLTIKLDIGTPVPVTLKLQRAGHEKGYEHDATFEPAGISPRRDHVPSAEEWVNSQLDGFATRVTWALNRKFVRAACERARYSVDEAARCLVAGVKPAAAIATLTEALGENAELVMTLLHPAPVEVLAEKPARTKAPTPPRPHPGAAGDDEDPIVN
jgi:hypothetical protein